MAVFGVRSVSSDDVAHVTLGYRLEDVRIVPELCCDSGRVLP